jgi:excisionase family DNA binding protein
MTLLTSTEAAGMLRLHPVTLRRMAREGRVTGAVRVGARWRFRADCSVEPVTASSTPAPRQRTRRPSPVPAALDEALVRHRPTATVTR